MGLTHLKRSNFEDKLHISHLFQYVSAYAYSDETKKGLIDSIEWALKEAAETREVQIVDQDGECCFHVSPAGYITLMLPWKQYQVYEEGTDE